MRPAVEHIRAALIRKPARGGLAEKRRHEGGGAIDHSGVDDLPLPRTLRLQQAAHHAEGQQHAAAAEIANEIEGRHRFVPRPANGVQRPCQRNVVDVMSGRLRQGALLSPARHAPIHQLRVARHTVLRPDAQALSDAGSKAFEQAVGALAEF